MLLLSSESHGANLLYNIYFNACILHTLILTSPNHFSTVWSVIEHNSTSIAWSQGGEEYPTYNKEEEG